MQYYSSCRKRRSYVDDLKKGQCLSMKTVIFSHSSGNSTGTLHFIWKVQANTSEAEIVAGNASAIHKVRPLLSSYHTREMRKQFFNDFGLFRCARPAVMREMYRRLTGMCGLALHCTTLHVCVICYNSS